MNDIFNIASTRELSASSAQFLLLDTVELCRGNQSPFLSV